MFKIIVLLVGLVCITGCSTKYCSLQPAADTLNTVFVEQWNNGVEKTSNNIHGLGEFFADEVTTCGSRLGNTLNTVYEPVSIQGTPERMNRVGNFFVQQWNQGISDTADTCKVIGQWMCLCCDEE